MSKVTTVRQRSAAAAKPVFSQAAGTGAGGRKLDLLSFDLNKSALIEASAGTGKTYTITYLILRLLLNAGLKGDLDHPLQLENILVVTFTNAAAADLKARIRDQIRNARLCINALQADLQDPLLEFDPLMRKLVAILQQSCQQAKAAGSSLNLSDYSRLLQRAERDIDKAAICTIHAFCNSALNQIYAFEAGEAFESELCADLDELRSEAFHQVWRQCFYGRDEGQLSAELNFLGIRTPENLSGLWDEISRVRTAGHERHGLLHFAIKDNTKFLDRSRLKASTLFSGFRERLRTMLQELSPGLEAIAADLRSALSADTVLQLSQAVAGEDCELLSCKGKGLKFKKDGKAVVGRILDLLQAPAVTPDFFNATLLKAAAEAPGSFIAYFNATTTPGKMLHAAEYLQLEGVLKGALRRFADLTADLDAWRTEFKCVLCLLADEKLEQLKAQRQLLSYDDVLLRLDQVLHQSGRGDALADMIRSRYETAMVDEFQDTDPVQYSIFEKLYLSSSRARCYLIGDPKQSIYSFRGSDINSYLKASAKIVECSGPTSIYTLDTNYRSAPGVVSAVNAIFSSDLNGHNSCPFLLPEIAFTKVNSFKGKSRFCFKGGAERGLYAVFLPPSADKVNKGELTALQAKACALQILRCLQEGELYGAQDDFARPRAVRPGDIAVLVRSAGESELIRNALQELQIAAVFYSDKDSVLGAAGQPSAEALHLLYLMEALTDPANRRKVTRLLGSKLLSLSGAEYCSLLAEDAFEKEVRLLSALQRVWQQNGFLSAFMQWFKDPVHDGLRRLLQFSDGERQLTNYLHIAELVQQTHGRIKGIKAQLRWFRQLIYARYGGLNSDETVKRLESERDQVQIRTIHNSKGLEFPLVFMPFLWQSNQVKSSGTEVLYYDEAEHKRLIDLYADPDSVAQQQLQDVQEDLRLTYVALTRACAANFLFFCPLSKRTGMQGRGLVRLLCTMTCPNDPSWPGDGTELEQARKDFAAAPECVECIDLSPDFATAPIKPYQEQQMQEAELRVSPFPQQGVDHDFTISSYSALVRGLHDRPLLPVSEERDDSADARVQAEPAPLSPFSFPRGTAAGTFLHSLLEHCDFASAHEDGMLQALCQQAASGMFGPVLQNWSAHPAASAEALSGWLENMINAVILEQDGKRLCLGDLKSGCFVPEMHYLMPVTHLDSAKLNELCAQSAQDVPEMAGSPVQLYLDERRVNGFLTGSLDLVCSFRLQGRPRYFVIDYKSTYLGPDYACYGPAQTAASVFDNRNRYDVQYLIYTVALHRLLKNRIPDYDYQQDVGGVLYLYLRGLKATASGLSPGVFFTKPRFEIVKKLDELLGGSHD